MPQHHDEETPLISFQETYRQKFMRITHQHRFRIIGTWAILIAITAAFTLSLQYALKDKRTPEEDAVVLCASDRSWFVALMLSIFLGPLGIMKTLYTSRAY